jgi:hypothetical protein
MEQVPSIALATTLPGGSSAWCAVLLARSLRAFGGSLAEAPLTAYTRDDADAASPAVLAALADARAEVLPLAAPEALARLPYGDLACAAAAAEERAEGRQGLVVWMCSDTLVLGELAPLVLEEGKRLGCRPVHHRLIGPLWGEPLDPFWQLLYERCGVGEARPFPMTTCTEMDPIRPYINAGLLVARPGEGLLRAWRDELARVASDAVFAEYLARGWQHRVFLHQAVLTAALLARLDRRDWQVLPPAVNYPLHLHRDVPPAWRPAALEDLVTARYDDLAETGWRTALPAREPLASWLREQLAQADARGG